MKEETKETRFYLRNFGCNVEIIIKKHISLERYIHIEKEVDEAIIKILKKANKRI